MIGMGELPHGETSVGGLAALPVESTVVGGATEGADVKSTAWVVRTTGFSVSGVLERECVEFETHVFSTWGDRLASVGLDPSGFAVRKGVLEAAVTVLVPVVRSAAYNTCGGPFLP